MDEQTPRRQSTDRLWWDPTVTAANPQIAWALSRSHVFEKGRTGGSDRGTPHHVVREQLIHVLWLKADWRLCTGAEQLHSSLTVGQARWSSQRTKTLSK